MEPYNDETNLLAFTHTVPMFLISLNRTPFILPDSHTKPSISDSTNALTSLPLQIHPALYYNPSQADS